MYNNKRPHSALQHLTPRDFLLKYGKIKTQNAEDFPIFQQNAGNGFGTWDLVINNQRGVATAHPEPADYVGDGMADLSVKIDDGYWHIDYAEDGFVKCDAGSIALRQSKDNVAKSNSLENSKSIWYINSYKIQSD